MGPIALDYHVNSIGREFNWVLERTVLK